MEQSTLRYEHLLDLHSEPILKMTTPMQDSSPVALVTSQRQHSAQLIESVQGWGRGIDWETVSDVKSIRAAWSDQIQRIAAEGSFLGYSRVVRLCRAIYLALNDSVVVLGDFSPSQLASLRSAIQAVVALVCRPQSESIAHVSEVIGHLQRSFALSDGEVNSPMSHLTSPSPKGNLPRTALDDTSTGHRDLDVYRSAQLDPLDHCFEEETWIVSQLASLAEDLSRETHGGHPAARLMHLFKGHRFFSQVDRVCLAGRVADANQLVIVDAVTSERCTETALRKGYSCFVNPEGSLFKMRPGTLRVFADCENVLASFANQDKPAQRSIALIAEQGLRSGLCLAIGRGSAIQGFLFLNSISKDLFKDISAGFAPLLSLFGLVASIGLEASGFHASSRFHGLLQDPSPDSIPRISTKFDPRDFARFMEQTMSYLDGTDTKLKFEVASRDNPIPFLYLPSQVVGILCEWIRRIHPAVSDPRILSIVLTTERGEVRFELEHARNVDSSADNEWLSRIAEQLNARLVNKPIRVGVHDKKVFVAFPLEPLLSHHNDLLYSTVY